MAKITSLQTLYWCPPGSRAHITAGINRDDAPLCSNALQKEVRHTLHIKHKDGCVKLIWVVKLGFEAQLAVGWWWEDIPTTLLSPSHTSFTRRNTDNVFAFAIYPSRSQNPFLNLFLTGQIPASVRLIYGPSPDLFECLISLLWHFQDGFWERDTELNIVFPSSVQINHVPVFVSLPLVWVRLCKLSLFIAITTSTLHLPVPLPFLPLHPPWLLGNRRWQ